MAIFQKRHYQAIAEVFADCDNAGFDCIEVQAVAKEFCRARFLKACGMEDEI